MESSQISRAGQTAESAIKKNGVKDPLSSFYLHHSDSPGMILVSQLLTGDNYPSWSRSMSIALYMKNKLGFVDGSIFKPMSTDQILMNSWIRNNNVVISWILNSVSKEISASVMFSESTTEVCVDLRERFQQSTTSNFQLRRDLINLSQDQNSVATYFTKLKTIWEELNNFRPNCSCGQCTCGGVKEMNSFLHSECVMTFLMGLNESFSQTRGQVLLMDLIPSINKVFSLIVQEERQRSVGVRSNALLDSSNAMAMATKVDSQIAVKNQKKKGPFVLIASCWVTRWTSATSYMVFLRVTILNPKLKPTQQMWRLHRSKALHPKLIWITRFFTAKQCHQLINMLSGHLKTSSSNSRR